MVEDSSEPVDDGRQAAPGRLAWGPYSVNAAMYGS